MDEAGNILEREKIEKRAKTNKLYYTCLSITKHRSFEVLISVCIFANTVILAMDKYPISAEEEALIESINLIFYVIFLLEMIIKLIGLGAFSYFRERANVFDMIIVVLSTMDVVIYMMQL